MRTDLGRARLALGAVLAGLVLFLGLVDSPFEVRGGPGFVAVGGRHLIQTVQITCWWAAAVAALLCLLLLATAGLWTRSVEPAAPGPAPRRPAGFALWLLLAAALGGALRWPLTTGGLWFDEGWVVRAVIVGSFEPTASVERPAPEQTFKRVAWLKTLWSYENPTNHLFQTVASRVSLETWRALTGRGPADFDEVALRLPTWLASLAAIPLLGVLVAAWGFPEAGIAASFLLALHPWHVQHGAEARGYGLVVLLAAATALTLVRALASGQLRWFLAFAAGQVLLVWTHPVTVFLTATLGGASLAQLLWSRRLPEAGRLAMAHAVAGAVAFLLMAPALAQVPGWRDPHQGAGPGRGWAPGLAAGRDLWVTAVTGYPMHVADSDPDLPYPSFRQLRREHGFLQPVVLVGLPILAATGLAAALRRRGPHRPVVAGVALGAPLALGVLASLGKVTGGFHPRFLIYVLVALIPGLCIGVSSLAAALGGERWRQARQAVGLALGVVAFAACAAPQLAVLTRYPYSGLRDALARVGAQPDRPPALRAGLGLGAEARVYDPGLVNLRGARDLRRLCERAGAEGRPLYVIRSGERRAGERLRGIAALLEQRRLFEPLGRFPGIAPETTARVLRYTGEPLPKARPRALDAAAPRRVDPPPRTP